VRVDIAPGTYAAKCGSSGYWARLRNFTGELNGIIANDNPRGREIVSIRRTDRGFTSTRCGIWPRLG
jgi:hypothetical protein